MAEYIDREALDNAICRNFKYFKDKSDFDQIGIIVMAIPTVDAVEVVRCGECIHRGNLQECDGRPLDWYCPNGVRKGEGE
jgi:hypothetical protein